MRQTAQRLTEWLLDEGKFGQEFEIHRPMGRLTMRNIFMVAFGIEIDTFGVEGTDHIPNRRRADATEEA